MTGLLTRFRRINGHRLELVAMEQNTVSPAEGEQIAHCQIILPAKPLAPKSVISELSGQNHQFAAHGPLSVIVKRSKHHEE